MIQVLRVIVVIVIIFIIRWVSSVLQCNGWKMVIQRFIVMVSSIEDLVMKVIWVIKIWVRQILKEILFDRFQSIVRVLGIVDVVRIKLVVVKSFSS